MHATCPAGIAAGHPATAAAGIEVLAEGGTAADAAVAATLASCVAETLMTGIAGGGFAAWWDPLTGRASLLDFFVAVPGLGTPRPAAPTHELEIPFGSEPVHYRVGIATCAVPGIPFGLEELWRLHGRLPWGRLCEPASRLAREGVPMPAAHAACLEMVAPAMTLAEGAGIYAPGGRLLNAGERLRQPGLETTLGHLAADGARAFSDGPVGAALVGLMDERGGLVTREDLAAYRPAWCEPVRARLAGAEVATRGGLARVHETLARLPRLQGLDPAARALALVTALRGPERPLGTTNLAVVDPEGRACVVTTSLGLGSGDWLAGLDVHLNSMLGESELLVAGHAAPGERMESMMAPTLAWDRAGLAAAAGSAGGSRLRSALVQVLAGVLDEGLPPQAAVTRPRLHPTREVVHAEPGVGEAALEALEAAGETVRRWPSLHHYFGGASIVARGGAGADPRRSGAAALVA